MRASRSRSTTVTAAYNNVPTDQNTPASPVPHMPAPAKHANFDNVLQRLHKLSIATASEPRSPLSPLGPAFSLSDAGSFQDREKAATNFAPRPAPALNLSPQSSTSSCSEFSSVSSVSSHDVFDAFVRSQSRVVRFLNLPPMPHLFLSSVFSQHGLTPMTMWVLRGSAADQSVWAVFQTHGEACAALSLSSQLMSVAAALESDLEPFTKLKQFELFSNAVSPQLYINSQPNQRVQRLSSLDPTLVVGAPSSFVALHGSGGVSMLPEDYTISSNPPNPRTSFRPGDWICRSQNCAVLNFASRRNLTCIGCGCPRSPTSNGNAAISSDAPQSPHSQQFSLQSSNPSSPSARPQPSPRFALASNAMQYPNTMSPTSYGFPQHQSSPSYGRSQQAVVNLPPPSPFGSPTNKTMSGHPLLTPSGRAFAVGGKVQNISSDPLSPCIMYWPDNEPFPEQGQIRPSGLMGVPQPPILNTGNRGPISHQPGDWICLKCNYLNWRRRKVCQTCLPYAEGNGDSISAAVQAERIALLTSVLAQTHLASTAAPPASPSHLHQHPHPIGRSHSTTPAQTHRPFVNFSPPPPPPPQQQPRGSVHRSQSHSELGSQFMHGYPIYQTSPHQNLTQQFQRQHHPSPLQRHTLSADASPVDVFAPAPLLPSFLQDIVQSPTLSPSSTSSADLSFEEYEESLPSSTRSTFSQSGADSVTASPLASIWRLDGEESKSLAAFPLARRELMGRGSTTSSRNSSLERHRVLLSSS